MDVSLSFFSVDKDLVVSPGGEFLEGEQEFSLESILVSLDIEFVLVVKSGKCSSQFSGEFSLEVSNLLSSTFFEVVDGKFGLVLDESGGFGNGELSFGVESLDGNLDFSVDVSFSLGEVVPGVVLEDLDLGDEPCVPVLTSIIQFEFSVNNNDADFLLNLEGP